MPSPVRDHERLLAAASVLEAALADYVVGQRWFRSKTERVRRVRLIDALPLVPAPAPIVLVFAAFELEAGDSETYVVPLVLREQGEAPPLAIAALGGFAPIWLCDASPDGRVGEALLALSFEGRAISGGELSILGSVSQSGEHEAAATRGRALGIEQSNSTYVMGERYLGKLIRKLDPGKSVEVEMLDALSRVNTRPSVAELVGEIEVRRGGAHEATLFVVQRFVENQGDAWKVTLEHAARFFDAVRSRRPALPARTERALVPDVAFELMPEYLELASRLGRRTAELHLALLGAEMPDFVPGAHDERSTREFHAELQEVATRVCAKLSSAELEQPLGALRTRVLARRPAIESFLARSASLPFPGKTIRVHGDYHLGQVLYTGDDFVIIDFDGEPQRNRSERRRRRSPLADVAGMLRSFHYAARGVLSGKVPGSGVRAEDRATLAPWAELFHAWAGSAFLAAYVPALEPSGALPARATERDRLLELHLLEKVFYELGYELDHRPGWVELPLFGLAGVLDSLGIDGTARAL
jgi:maltose alpha-D-glucosyltransferase/alpha-amylase